MCIIITNPGNGGVNWALADYAAVKNRHGYGLAFPRADGRVAVWHSLLWSKLRWKAQLLDSEGVPFVLHMRYATHGAKTRENCHPFRITGQNMVMAHNGVLRTLDVPPGEVDSRVLAQLISGLPHDWMLDDDLLEKVTMLTGDSRLAFLDGDGSVFFVNEEAGVWRNGCWYSQPALFQPKPRKQTQDPWNPATWRRTDKVAAPKPKPKKETPPKQGNLFGYTYSGLGPDGRGTRT